MGKSVSVLTNANAYLDGITDLFGRANEITLPTVKAKVLEHQGLGMIGPMDIPVGLEKLEVKIKWGGLYADTLKVALNFFKAHKLQFRGSLETWDETGKTAEVPYTLLVTGKWTEAPLGTLKAQEQSENEDVLSCTYVQLVIDGEEVVEIDVVNNIWKAGGEDLLAQFRANQGSA